MSDENRVEKRWSDHPAASFFMFVMTRFATKKKRHHETDKLLIQTPDSAHQC
jgi:hypothetical protein